MNLAVVNEAVTEEWQAFLQDFLLRKSREQTL